MRSQTPDLVMPEELSAAQKAVDRAVVRLQKATTALNAIRAKARIRCCRCGSEEPIATQTYIQTYWYVSPHGCTEGDYWNAGESNWKCPKCGFKNRFDNMKDKYTSIPNDFYRPDIVAARQFFGAQRDCYCRHSGLYPQICDECRKAESRISIPMEAERNG